MRNDMDEHGISIKGGIGIVVVFDVTMDGVRGGIGDFRGDTFEELDGTVGAFIRFPELRIKSEYT